ncbi:hypothetical protein MOJ79_16250 [Calidifontimicrobium sp. SYSU G02091]|uniref:hypothetical protein n=1 Tax=Calidifontimicrobium sp. SYSU G02091 TaxID=2926421 RepID=UPI001F53D66B|nr:hypothetical protein [Calidifontimicrobium sp. SYSU G02091]MCI1193387.1 hypothetical protein [Calidifontimicrobium sp. SYSU G02091]
MKVNPMKPVSRVMSGPVLVASIVRTGNGRPGSPVRWMPYWSQIAERLGAPVPPPRFSSRHEAEAMAMLWAHTRLAHAARVERER